MANKPGMGDRLPKLLLVCIGVTAVLFTPSANAIKLRSYAAAARHMADPAASEAGEPSPAQTWADETSSAIQKNIAEAAKSAMKFQTAGTEKVIAASEAAVAAASEAAAQAEEGAGAEALVFKVDPAAEDGVKMEPAPGQNDPPVMLRNPDDYMDEVETTTDFMGSHSYETDIKELLGEVDESENKVKGLKLRIVEKENFVDSLIKRESLLGEDLSRDKVAVANLNAHVKALNARVERLKSEKELTQLEAQFHQYSDAAEKMSGQVAELQDVKSALYSKMQGLHSRIGPLRQAEDANMRLSINADPASQTAVMLAAAQQMMGKGPSGAAGGAAAGAAAGASGAAAPAAAPARL